MSPWQAWEDRPKLEHVQVQGVELRPGARVRLWPRRRADIFDLVLEGKTATVLAIEQDYENRIYLAVAVDADPGKEFGEESKPAHRFFFRPEEVEPLSEAKESDP